MNYFEKLFHACAITWGVAFLLGFTGLAQADDYRHKTTTEFNVNGPYLMGGAMYNCYLTKEFEKRFGCIVDPKDRTTVIGMNPTPDYNSFHWKMLNTDDVNTLRGPNDNASRYLDGSINGFFFFTSSSEINS